MASLKVYFWQICVIRKTHKFFYIAVDWTELNGYERLQQWSSAVERKRESVHNNGLILLQS